MDQNYKEKTLENLTKAESILIAVSDNSDLDGLASGLAIYLSCLKLGKNVSILAKSPSVGQALTLYGIDKIGKATGKKNLVIVINNAVKSVDKVTYFLDGDQLKIVVHPFPGSQGVSREQISSEETLSKPNLVFAIGFDMQESLMQFITHEQNIDSSVWTVAINKKNLNQKFAQSHVFNPEAMSLAEITGQLLQDLALPVDEDIAFNLYSGIAQATSSFAPNKTGPLSFQIAAWLVKFGAGRASLAVESSKASLSTEPHFAKLLNQKSASPFSSFDMTSIDDVEPEKRSQEDWLKPPKIYQGSKSFEKGN